MAYLTIATMAGDPSLISRLTAAAAQEHKPKPYDAWVFDHIWDLAATPGWAEAWESAVASGNESPGSDPGVITDSMVLAAVQPMGAES